LISENNEVKLKSENKKSKKKKEGE
jgi:hypothetical protein